jgi:sterol desaturase/sphingolipid hydroxylase (fatty acid hydroxylase superfamily)
MICQIHFADYLLHTKEKQAQFIIIFILFTLQYVFEHIFPQQKKYNSGKRELANLLIGILNVLLLFIPSVIMVQVIELSAQFNFGLLHFIKIPFALNVLFTILVMDLGMYWWHRFNHSTRLFWHFHKFHHRDTNMNTTTALRFHAVELLFASFFKSIYIFFAGLSFVPVLIYETLFFIIVVFHHSNINISVNFDLIYRKIFSSPLMHRIHHSNKQEETNTNYGSVFSFWDRLFGTYKKEASGNIIFGVDESSN